MNKYEAVIMFYPEVEEEKRNASFERLKKVIEKDGKINNVDEWGMKKLAYEIDYKNEAYYIFVEFETKAEDIAEINRIAKIMDPVMRQMIIKVED
ncbi:30S ribosomal protein S6 [Peptoniphilus phoceensis]|uniref:30S ribosomal protein S6 n=1 Tax=Peptoniphilus phoceensis TaxID=1720298 RepID=UPI00078164A2|nr:30S ribosomal protein S6 [Peptoniphilus phoceensis]